MGGVVTQTDRLSARTPADQSTGSPNLLGYARRVFDVVYVSPHLDDAVFSAGGAIALDVRSGRRVAVATVFSRGGEEALRRREDRTALARLGAAQIDLALAEAPARDPSLVGARLFAPLGDGSAPLVDEVRAALASVARGAEVVAPLGVGRHADHQIVHAASAALDGKVSYYEDLPYALCRPLVARRLAALGSPVAVAGGGIGRVLSFWVIARFWAERPLLHDAAPWIARPLAAAMIAWWQWRGATDRLAPARPFTEERIDVSAAIDDKLAAIAAYESQWRRFFPSVAGFRSALAAHALALGSRVAIERRWRRA